MTITRDDFRIRRTPAGYTISQRIGSGWQRLADTHPTRDSARAFIDTAITRV